MSQNPILVPVSRYIVLLSLCMVAFANAQNQDRCGQFTDVLKVGFDEREIATTVNEARDLYRWACIEEYRSEGDTSSVSLNARYKIFSAGAKRNSSSFEEYQSKNCQLSEDTVANYVASSMRERTVNQGVLDAWTSCVTSETEVTIIPGVFLDQTRVNFSLKKSTREDVFLNGISSINFKCSASGDREVTATGIDGDQVPIARDEALNITCRRVPVQQEIGGVPIDVYPSDVLSLDLTTGFHNLEFVERRIGSAASEFTELQARIGALDAELSQLVDNHRKTQDRLEALLERRWYNVTEVRKEDQCYLNKSGYPLEIAVSTSASNNRIRRNYNFCRLDIFVDGERILGQIDNNEDFAKYCAATATVPPGARYRIDADGYRQGEIVMWWELREGDAADIQECDGR